MRLVKMLRSSEQRSHQETNCVSLIGAWSSCRHPRRLLQIAKSFFSSFSWPGSQLQTALTTRPGLVCELKEDPSFFSSFVDEPNTLLQTSVCGGWQDFM